MKENNNIIVFQDHIINTKGLRYVYKTWRDEITLILRYKKFSIELKINNKDGLDQRDNLMALIFNMMKTH